jgi:hypothetical protein
MGRFVLLAALLLVGVGTALGDSSLPACDDGDPCTADRRDGPVCAHAPIAGDCWVIAEATLTATAQASAGGRSASCRIRCRSAASSTFALLDDGTYATDAGRLVGGCIGGVAVTVPPEKGRVAAGRRGSLLLAPDDLTELEATLHRCAGPSLVLKDYRTRVRVADDGASLTGVSRLRYRLRNRVPVHAAEVFRFRAVPRSQSLAATERSAGRAGLPLCATDLRPKCVQY